MKIFICLAFLIVSNIFAILGVKAAASKELVLVGNIPGEYLGKNKNEFFLGIVVFKDRVITNVQEIIIEKSKEKPTSVSHSRPFHHKILEDYKKRNALVIIASPDNGKNFDVIYPGLINLHNHTKQNNLPVWKQARGQFENRFEWRAWADYKKAVSGNMNPWVGYGSAISCAAFRWSELQAMTLGTIYLQGPSECVDNFAIHRVEDASAFISKKKAVQAPTDIIIPADMVFVWQTLRPIIQKGKTYEEALAQVLTEGVGEWKGCDGLRGKITATNINSQESLKILSNQAALKKACSITPENEKLLPEKFVRYVYWIHKTIAGKKKYLDDPNHAAIIAHLAEGRREDPYNNIEFKLLEMLGFIRPHVNLVHAVGVELDDLKKIIRNDMGIVWSVFSNLLLYGETLDLKKIKQVEEEARKEFPNKKFLLALGSDWVPTGSKSVLEEMRVARDYIDKNELQALYTDEDLFKMVTENPAKMIQHWEIDTKNGEHGIGRIAVGAMGSVIVVKENHKNPYTNLVRYSDEKSVNLVVVDGEPIYGNFPYLEQVGHNLSTVEFVNKYISNFKEVVSEAKIPSPLLSASSTSSDDEGVTNAEELSTSQDVLPSAKNEKMDFLYNIATIAKSLQIQTDDQCNLNIAKAFVHQNSLEMNRLKDFQQKTGLNLDRYEDLQRILGLNILTQTKNRASNEKQEYLVQYFPPLLTCNDEAHKKRIDDILVPTRDEEDQNMRDLKEREELRMQGRLGSVPKKLADQYKK